jgi:hypothetical protein
MRTKYILSTRLWLLIIASGNVSAVGCLAWSAKNDRRKSSLLSVIDVQYQWFQTFLKACGNACFYFGNRELTRTFSM